MAAQAQQLRRSFLISGAALALVVVAVLAAVLAQGARSTLQHLADRRGREVAIRVAALASTYMRERQREVETFAAYPQVVAAARDAGLKVVEQKLDQLEAPVLERLFARSRTVGGDPQLERFLRDYTQRSGIAELFFTESHGYNVLASERTSDFVQSDEVWWQSAFRDGAFEGEPQYDSSASTVSVEYDVAIRTPGVARPVGVLKVVFPLDRLSSLLAVSDLGDSAYLEVVDDRGRLLVASDPSLLLRPAPEQGLIPRTDSTASRVVPTPRGAELVVSVPANRGRWWVLFRQPTRLAYAAWYAALRSILIATPVLLAFLIVGLWAYSRWLDRRVTAPVRQAGLIAGRVAGGDLSATVDSQRGGAAEVGELMGSIHSMIVALRKLVGAIRGAADEAAAMAAEISASTEQMSASTEEMASTCQDLSRRAGEQAQLVRAAADDAARILQIATILAAGAGESARRNADVSQLARHHKDALDQSTAQLAQLAAEIEKGAQEADALAQASGDIQKFVTQAKSVATQTNMLALNAAIEAARAGPQGRGFAVVADEVRKLASLAAASAGDTADIVRGVLARVQATRARFVRLAQGSNAAREAAQLAAQGLTTVAGEAEANDAWSREIATSASEVRGLVEEIAARLTQVAQSTDGLLASAEEIAASSEEQSASTEEIASSANQLAQAADHLTGTVKTFRLLADDSQTPARQAAD